MQRQSSEMGRAARSGALTVRQAVFELLRQFDMTTVFGNPGSTELRMFRDWPEDFRYVLGLQESIVVAMADGFAQARRCAALVNLHSAGGVGHALCSVFTAWRNQTPLVILAGQQTRAMLPTDPFLCARAAVDFPKPYVKWSVEPARAEDVPHALAQAIYTALQRPSGPVFLSVPEDDWDMTCEPIARREVTFRVAPDAAAIERLAAVLEDSERPALVVGAAVDQDEAWQATVELAERLQARVWHAAMAGRRGFPQGHRLFAGFLPPLRQPLADKLSAHDVVLVLGAPVFTYHVHTGGDYIAPATRLFQITDDAEQAARAPVGDSIVGSVSLAVQQLLLRVRGGTRSAPPAVPTPVAPLVTDPIGGEYAMHVIARSLPAGAVIVEEAPSHRNAFNEHVMIDSSGGFYACASGGLGFALPAAVGVALADPARKVVAILGDGSSLYTIQALWSAAQHRLPITFVVLNNSGYGAVKSLGARLGIDAMPGSDIGDVDFIAIAEGFGCAALRVERAAELMPALQRAHAAPRPTLVEVLMNPAADKLY